MLVVGEFYPVFLISLLSKGMVKLIDSSKASSPKPVENASTSPRRQYPRPERVASLMLCCGAARTWALRQSCGIRASFASSRRSTLMRSGSSMWSTRSAGRCGPARTRILGILTRLSRNKRREMTDEKGEVGSLDWHGLLFS